MDCGNMQDPRVAMITLVNSSKYLETVDIIRASQVSRLWYEITTHNIFWRTITISSCNVVDIRGLVRTIKDHGSKTLDLRNPPNTRFRSVSPPLKFWRELTSLLNSVTTLSSLYLGECPLEVVEWLEEGPLKKTLRFLSIESSGCLDPRQVKNFINLKELHSVFNKGMSQLKSIYRFTATGSWNYLSIETVGFPQMHPKECGPMLLVDTSKKLIWHLENLKKLSLDNCGFQWPSCELLGAVASHETITELELLNFQVFPTFKTQLAMCTRLKKLFIVPCLDTVLNAHQHIIDAVSSLRESLAEFTLGFYHEFLMTAELKLKDAMKECSNMGYYIGSEKELFIPFRRICRCEVTPCACASDFHIDFITLNVLRIYMSRLFTKTKIELIELP